MKRTALKYFNIVNEIGKVTMELFNGRSKRHGAKQWSRTKRASPRLSSSKTRRITLNNVSQYSEDSLSATGYLYSFKNSRAISFFSANICHHGRHIGKRAVATSNSGNSFWFYQDAHYPRTQKWPQPCEKNTTKTIHRIWFMLVTIMFIIFLVHVEYTMFTCGLASFLYLGFSDCRKFTSSNTIPFSYS
jgi:hypothetical protein